jgi:hypothetical protein
MSEKSSETNINGKILVTNIPFEDDILDNDEISNYLSENQINILRNESILVNGKMFYPINFFLINQYYSKLIDTNDDVSRLFQIFKDKNKNITDNQILKEKFISLFNYIQYNETVMTKENFYLTNENNPIKVKLFYLSGYKNNYPELDYLGYLQGIQNPQDTELKIIFSGKFYSQDTNSLMSKIANNIYMSSVGLNEKQIAINFLLLHNLESGVYSRGKNKETIINLKSIYPDTYSSIEQKMIRPVEQDQPTVRIIKRGGKKNTKKLRKLRIKSKRRFIMKR